MNVSLWISALSLSMIGFQAAAAPGSAPMRFSESTEFNEVVQPKVQIVTRHSLAAHLGITADDAVFMSPRSFRTESFNSEHFELEPLAEDSSGS